MNQNYIIKDRIDLSSNKVAFIYENDLKFRHSRNININIDSDKNEFDTKDLKDKFSINYDSIEYRLKELKKDNNLTSLDLSSIKINKNNILNLPIDYSKVLFLFLNDNNLIGELDLRLFNNLEVLDIENNKVTNLIVSSTLKELVVNNNNLTLLPNNINPIRIKANNNNLTEIPTTYKKIELIEISKNKITKVSNFNNLKRLIIDSNPLEYINNLPYLTFLDISDTNKVNMELLPELTHLVANSTKLESIPKFENLDTLEIINTPVNKLQFFPKFNLILCSYNLTKNISSKYIDIGKAIIKVKHNYLICISKEETE
jgi:hypothetical protein